MHSDRELLERAAKAAGISLIWRDKYDAGYLDEWIVDHPNPHWVLDEWPHKKWNPLQDDGDAFRLAVKLGLQLDVLTGLHVAAGYGNTQKHTLQRQNEVVEEVGSDPYAATRRAIVLAAAEMA